MIVKFLFIGLGGAFGAVARYVISGLDYRLSLGLFPLSTLIINLGGSLLIGLLWWLFEVYAVAAHVRMFIFIGLLGGFTTFSTFALENFNLMRDGEHAMVLWNVVLSNVLGIALVYVGYALARAIIGGLR